MVTVKGYCPEQGKEVSISFDVLDKENKCAGVIRCEYVRNMNECRQCKCPIFAQSGYHH